ncbi:hypothetical protein RB598_008426 [Gaeumannomyces tritici]
MSSTYMGTVYPPDYFNGSRPDHTPGQRSVAVAAAATAQEPAAVLSHLSPTSAQYTSSAASPTFLAQSSPAESTPASLQYQTSDFTSDGFSDEFFGVDFSTLENGTPSFLGEDAGASGSQGLTLVSGPLSYQTPDPASSNPDGGSQGYLLSPEQTPSLHTISPPNKESRGHQAALPSTRLFEAPSTEDLLKSEQSSPHSHFTTPGTSEDSLVAGAPAMSGQSPRVMVSMYDQDGYVPVGDMAPPEFLLDPTSTGFAPDDTVRPSPVVSRDTTGRWMPDSSTGQGGIEPSGRIAGETASVNDLAATRVVQERNIGVQIWLDGNGRGGAEPPPSASESNLNGVSSREIPLGSETENVAQPGRIYYVEGGSGPLTQEDVDIMRQNRNWEDAPAVFAISSPGDQHCQPGTSADAMRKFEKMCRDNDSVVSRAATWGTRRRSLPIDVDMEGIVSGNFLKKLSISRGEFFKDLRTLVRRPSASNLANLKRSLSSPSQDDDLRHSTDGSGERRQSRDSLAPPTKSGGWTTKRHPTPSINTALVGMGSSVASIGATHARSGSISSTTPVVTPKSPFTLKVNIGRRRAKSELVKPGIEGSFSNIADMWKKTGGPPVALAKAPALVDQDDDDDDDDDLDDGEASSEAVKLIDDVVPNLSGFHQHILKLNPMLAQTNGYLVDRIAHQQVVRFKSLCNAKIKHAGSVQTQRCPAGRNLCIALGGSAVLLESKSDSRGLDPLSARPQGSDDDVSTPLEGAIGPESFPQDIPMPPTQSLPAEFECQLCFTPKKFQKPSDWTKHVHEDVQPFTCTWDRCRDPKIFKRKADWVRHENEGHRHLEWWTCDVDDCRHTCYRRDNFLQHLVREHKFSEPKVKTKAAIKRTGALDPTWQRVERCHVETRDSPQNEPCRFCGKTFPTWKKLTVHLAKHMEQISLPLLRLVARKQLDADTIISPIQDPPQRFFEALSAKDEPPSLSFGHSSGVFQPQTSQPPIGPMQFPAHQGDFGFPVGAPGGSAFQTQHQRPASFGGFVGGIQDMGMSQVGTTSFQPTPSYFNLPVTTGPFGSVQQSYMPVTNELEPFPHLSMVTPIDAMSMPAPAPSPMQYSHMMDPASAGGGHFTPQGSASPYARSPHQQPGHSFY